MVSADTLVGAGGGRNNAIRRTAVTVNSVLVLRLLNAAPPYCPINGSNEESEAALNQDAEANAVKLDSAPTSPMVISAPEGNGYAPVSTNLVTQSTDTTPVHEYPHGHPDHPVGTQTTTGASDVKEWGQRYLRSHPLASLETVGGQVQLGVRTVEYFFTGLFRGRFQFREFIQQAAFMAGTAFLPTLFVTIPIGVTLSIQFSLLAGQVGATSLAGAATGLVVIRQGASLVAAILLAAAVGSAVCADLGSRTMREEIDAMEVMGVSVINRLVVPRFAAVIVVGVALTGWACFVGFLAGYVFNVYMQGGTPGSFTSTFASFARTDDFVLAFVKAIVFGAIVAVVSCHKGLTTRGGPAGVANSVNAAVVESILLLMAVNVGMSQLFILIFPRTSL